MTDPAEPRRRAGRRVAAATGLSAAALAMAAPAAANHGKPNQWPDSRRQAVQGVSLTRVGNVASDWGQLTLDSTDVVISTGPDDIWVEDFGFGDNRNSGYTRPTFSGTGDLECFQSRCPFFRVQFNTDLVFPDAHWKKVGCHEFGHTAGLLHRTTTDSCMVQGRSSPEKAVLDAHDRKTINLNVAGV